MDRAGDVAADACGRARDITRRSGVGIVSAAIVSAAIGPRRWILRRRIRWRWCGGGGPVRRAVAGLDPTNITRGNRSRTVVRCVIPVGRPVIICGRGRVIPGRWRIITLCCGAADRNDDQRGGDQTNTCAHDANPTTPKHAFCREDWAATRQQSEQKPATRERRLAT